MSKHATKAVQSVEVKDADEGKVRAVVATLGVKDKDGDIIKRGAFGTQDVKVSAFNHTSWQGALPVGRGTVTESGEKAIFDGRFFMDTPHGEATFRTVKGLDELGEWSFGFDITEEAAPDEEQRQQGVVRVLKGLDVHEVSPVLRGAGVDTETLVAKSVGLDLSDLIEGYCEAEVLSAEEVAEAKSYLDGVAEDFEAETKSDEKQETKDDVDEQAAVEMGRMVLMQAKDGR